MICPKCLVAHMIQHPEKPTVWDKCPICGFCKQHDYEPVPRVAVLTDEGNNYLLYR